MGHATTRARERYGLELTDQDLKALALQVENGKTVLLGKDGAERHLASLNGQALIVLGKRHGHRFAIITVLPKNHTDQPRTHRKRRPKNRAMRNGRRGKQHKRPEGREAAR